MRFQIKPGYKTPDVFFKRTLVKGAIPTRRTDGGNSPGLLLIDREATFFVGK